MLRGAHGIVVVAALAALVGCVTDPPPPPVLSIAERTCEAQPSFGGAHTLVLDPKGETEKSEIQLNMSEAGCLKLSGGDKAVYAIVALPPIDTDYVISVESIPIGNGVFAPSLNFLDEKGHPLRAVSGDAFVFRGAVLSVLLRHHAGERFLLVLSDPDAVGQSFSRTIEAVQSGGGVMVGYAYVQTYYGSDHTLDLQFAHSGVVSVRVEPVRQPASH